MRYLEALALALALTSTCPAQATNGTFSPPTRVVTLPTDFDKPFVTSGPSQTAREAVPKRFGVDGDQSMGAQPDFVLKVPRDVSNVTWSVAGFRGEVRVRPLANYLIDGKRGGAPGGSLAAGDYAVTLVANARPPAEWTLVVRTATSSVDLTERHGEPSADASIADHELGLYLPFVDQQRFHGPQVQAVRLAHQLFSTLPRSFFVFSKTDLPHAKAGEPLLVVITPSPRTILSQAITADGTMVDVRLDELVTQPARIVVSMTPSKLAVRAAKDGELWADEEFLLLLDERSEQVLAYKTKKKALSACWEREFDKVDPSHNSGRFELATTRGGKVTRVENLADKYARQVRASCKVAQFEAQRDRWEQQVIRAFETEREAWSRALKARMDELFSAR